MARPSKNDYSNLLIAENPMIIQPTLAIVLGSNRAIILQHVCYWTKKVEHIRKTKQKYILLGDDGKPIYEIPIGTALNWVYNSYPEWKENFPWIGLGTIKHHFTELEKLGFLFSDEFNKFAVDRTKWYAINPKISLVIEKLLSGPRKAHIVANEIDAESKNKEYLPYCTFSPKELSQEEDTENTYF